jgi:hypothetical protein
MADKELQAALARISALQEQLAILKSRVDSTAALAQSEVSARIAADSAITTKINALQSSVSAMQGNTTV